ncbi:MAG: CPBP family intramembrane metalloprotease, partial [Clostridiales bacterium]|nr:CPBP family intramembrane metalloprotease [Clostridiales bacterium]
TMVYAKTSISVLPHAKPTFWGIFAALLLWVGLLFGFSLINEYFVRFLELTGYHRLTSVLPVMDTFGKYLLTVLIIAVLPALAEELLFRGILLSGTEGGKPWQRILLCGALFCVFHQNPMQTPYQFLCGCAFAYLALKTGNVYLAVGVHFLNNFYILTATYLGIPTFGTVATIVATAIGLLAFIGAMLILHFKTPKLAFHPTGDKPVKRTFLWSLPGVCACIIMWISNFITGFGG